MSNVRTDVANRLAFLKIRVKLGIATADEREELQGAVTIVGDGAIAVTPGTWLGTSEEFARSGQGLIGDARREVVGDEVETAIDAVIESHRPQEIQQAPNDDAGMYGEATENEKKLFGDGYKPKRARVVHGEISR
jgi:hypothetical protein